MEWTMVFDTGVFFLSTAVRGDSTGAPIYANINHRLADLEINGKTVAGGYPIDVPVTYRVEMDWDTRLWTFFIDDVAVPEATDEPFGTNSEAPIRGLSFSFGGQTVLDVGFDDITIWASECPTPVEPSTWGRMKAAYRSP
jgi:hypothetical protein